MIGAVRWIIAGLILYIYGKATSKERIKAVHWRTAVIVGALLIFMGNGIVIWAEQYVSSGLTAVIISSTPLIIVLLEWLRPGGKSPTLLEMGGIAIGLAAVTILFADDMAIERNYNTYISIAGIFVGMLSWSFGSVYSRQAPHPKSSILYVGMQMLAGGVIFLIVSTISMEYKVDPAAISLFSAGSLLYLTIFGSIIAFTSYIWLLNNTSLAKASTYAYVNPIVALFLGWILADEPFTPKIAAVSAIIILSVLLINLSKSSKNGKKPESCNNKS